MYISEALSKFEGYRLDELAQRAAEKNARLDITGYLYFERQRFLQYIEGEPNTLESLMATIERDNRHEVIHVLKTDDLPSRKFPDWSMQQLRREDMIGIRMENILADYLKMLKTESVDWSSKSEKNIWEMVDTISRFSSHIVSR